METQLTGNLDEISRALSAVWPSQHDLGLILAAPISASVLYHGVACLPYATFASTQLKPPREILQLPPPDAHPVLVARRLLLLAAFLQSVPPRSASEDGADFNAIMCRAVNTAGRLVTSNDELLVSLDGIECVMIESMYWNNAGHLRRSWLTNRRAMVMAQMMGLHTGACSAAAVLEPETRNRIDPSYMWFRLVVTDRYTSLMLGLPQGTLENVFASPKALGKCMPMERMERLESVASSLILQRNSSERTNFAATQEIDTMLKEAAALMPPQWWLMTPGPEDSKSNDTKAFEESIRFTNHFAHQHLLVQLHLPYILLPSSANPNYDYSKMTAIGASRAVVAMFVSFRSPASSHSYCRGIDFVAFIASTTLCLGHIEARRQHQTNTGKGATVFQSLQHQRLSDRGLLERTLEIMQTMARDNQDVVAHKISNILQPLLDVEYNSAKGACYQASALPEAEKQEIGSLGDVTESLGVLHIRIPYFGTIKIEHNSEAFNAAKPAKAGPVDQYLEAFVSQTSEANTVPRDEAIISVAREPLRCEQVNITPAGYEITASLPFNSDWQAVPSYLDSPNPLQQGGVSNGASCLPPDDDVYGSDEPHLFVPGLAAGIDDWALQGVDTALFSSLTRGGSFDFGEPRP